jgi:hypothetical protein
MTAKDLLRLEGKAGVRYQESSALLKMTKRKVFISRSPAQLLT